MNPAYRIFSMNGHEQHYELFSTAAMPVPVLDDSDIESNISSEDAGSFTELTTPQTSPLHMKAAEGVKQELRNAIKCRRVAKGLEEFPNLEAKRPKLEQLSPAEHEKRRLRRERNKVAAFKCRQRRKEHIQELEIESDGIEECNTELEKEITALNEQRKQLEEILKVHVCLLSNKDSGSGNNNHDGSKTVSDTCSTEAAKPNGSGSPTTPTGSFDHVPA